MHYDVFNGDADGIIALLQLRLSQKEQQPSESTLITGVKRDISLLKEVDVNIATSVTVLDISLEKNTDALIQLLEKEVNVFYVDHHRTGDIPQSKQLVSLLDTDANTCTSLLVNNHLGGEFATWAIAAAFGDNMQTSAETLAEQNNLTLAQQSLLKELGVYINYNGYGRSVDDLHFHPGDLFHKLLKYEDPFDLINEQGSVFSQLKDAYLADMNKAKNADVLVENANFKAVQLADEAWARRVSGVFGNDLANASPNKAHAVLTLNADNSYTVSLRAPLSNKQGAGELCASFPTGGGRAAAAGINALPQEMLSDFFDSVSKYYA
ncbi:DHH family phosphoesterase [Candidatus Colwellia aromaticivorans]|uniref:DHH family phosphoesterase n=1 Tax=Candidatus Colwellia aromaticivorans TaxID=2267621 RepID=UPI000DF23089|nr:DHH family phosphoesterase [Candidatus Colwellia aromaticivorans]